MPQRSRTLVDWLLVRAWIEPDHEHSLRVVIRHPSSADGESDTEQVFPDADRAASFVRLWLNGLIRRWESGERFAPRRRWDIDHLDDSDDADDRES